MTVTLGPEFGNPAYEKTEQRPTYENEIEWLFGPDEEKAMIDFTHFRDWGTMYVTTIICDKEITRTELEEAILNFFPGAQFIPEMTINYR